MCACAAFWRIVSKSCDEIRILNCLFFRIFSSVSFVSLYQTKAQRSGFCLELRSKGAERGMPSPAGRYTRSGLCDEVVGMGFCPQTAFGGEPGHRRLAKCDAGSFVGTSSISLAPPQAAGLVHSAAPPLKIAIALLDCDFVLCTSVQRGLFLPRRTHTRCRGRKPHTAATRASRRAPGARYTHRVDCADCFHGQKIGTFGTLEGNPPFAVATVGICQNPVFP